MWALAQAPQLLAPRGYIMWDYSGQHGDTILVTLKPTQQDVNQRNVLSAAIDLEWKVPGRGWRPVPLVPGNFDPLRAARVFPRTTDPIDVSLRIPLAAYSPPVPDRHELRYRVRAAREAASNPAPTVVDDFVIPKTITIAAVALPPPPPPPIRSRQPGTTDPAPPTDRDHPHLVEFTLQAPGAAAE